MGHIWISYIITYKTQCTLGELIPDHLRERWEPWPLHHLGLHNDVGQNRDIRTLLDLGSSNLRGVTSPLMEESILRPQIPKQQAPTHPLYIKGMSHNLTRKKKNFLPRRENFFFLVKLWLISNFSKFFQFFLLIFFFLFAIFLQFLDLMLTL